MLLDSALIIVGLVITAWSANRLIDGAVGIANRLKLSPLIIGMTIVAMGTSFPEFSVSFASALKGTPDLAVGNVVGSNIVNALFIVGISALVAPIKLDKSTVHRSMPFSVLASVVLVCMCIDSEISRFDALILAALFIVFLIYTIKVEKKKNNTPADESISKKQYKLPFCILLIVIGLVGLVFGSQIFVDSATKVASALGVSDAIIGLTIVAVGTSLPELASSIAAARKGESALVIGNILGSNVFNILMILGLTGIICPMQIANITFVDFAVLIVSMLLLWFLSYTKYKVNRWEGALLTGCYLVYIAWLIISL